MHDINYLNRCYNLLINLHKVVAVQFFLAVAIFKSFLCRRSFLVFFDMIKKTMEAAQNDLMIWCIVQELLLMVLHISKKTSSSISFAFENRP